MDRAGVPNPEQREMVRRLDRECERHYGLGEEHDVRQKLARLSRWWDPDLLVYVRRAIEMLKAERSACEHAGLHVLPPGKLSGDLVLGEAVCASPSKAELVLDSNALIFNTLVVGLPGKGKTHLVRRLLGVLARVRPDVRILVFDPNNSYVDVCVPPDWASLDWREVRVNRLCAPPGYPCALWKAEVVDALSRGELLHSRYLCMRRVDALFERAGVPLVDDGVTPVPSLFDLRDDLAANRERPGSKDEAYRQSALGVLDGILRTTGSVYDCARGMESGLINSRLRVSTLGLSPRESSERFITGVEHYAYRARCTVPVLAPPRLHLLNVAEEAQTLLESRPGAPIAMYQEMLQRSRALGIGYVFICQDISSIAPIVFSGISNYFVFGQSSAQNKRVARNILDLDREEALLLGELGTGECFVKFTGHPEWPFPFTARITP